MVLVNLEVNTNSNSCKLIPIYK